MSYAALFSLSASTLATSKPRPWHRSNPAPSWLHSLLFSNGRKTVNNPEPPITLLAFNLFPFDALVDAHPVLRAACRADIFHPAEPQREVSLFVRLYPIDCATLRAGHLPFLAGASAQALHRHVTVVAVKGKRNADIDAKKSRA